MAFVEKPPPGRAPTDWINAGTYVLEPSVLDRIPPRADRLDRARDVSRACSTRPGRLFAIAERRLLARHRHAREVPRGARRRARRARSACRRCPARSRRRPASGQQGACSIAADAHVEPPGRCSAPAPASASGARVEPGGARRRVRDREGRERGAVGACSNGRAWRSRRRLVDAVIGRQATVEPGAVAAGGTIVGASGVIAAGSRLSGARVPVRASTTPCECSSPAAPGSSARPSSTGCSPRATTSTSSTTCRPVRSRTSPTPGPVAATASRSTGSTSARPASPSSSCTASPRSMFHLAAQADVRVSVAQPGASTPRSTSSARSTSSRARSRRERARSCSPARAARSTACPTTFPSREGHPQRPLSPYGVSKKAVGDYLHYYREIHGLEYTVLALANVYGPRQDPHGEAGVVAIFAGQLLERESPDDLRRRRADPRLRVRRRRRRRVRARRRQGRRAHREHRHRRRDERAAALRHDGARWPASTSRPRYARRARRRARSGRRSTPAAAAIHSGWKPWTALEDGLAPHARLVPYRPRRVPPVAPGPNVS